MNSIFRCLRSGLLLLLLASPSLSQAEMEKNALICDTGICFYWWPKLPEVTGWHHDRDSSFNIDANAQVPDGKTFADSDAVIYAVGPYKPRMPKTKSIDQLIENDKSSFLSSTPELIIKETERISTGDGQTLRSFTFTPNGKGNWERVSYGEEGDF